MKQVIVCHQHHQTAEKKICYSGITFLTCCKRLDSLSVCSINHLYYTIKSSWQWTVKPILPNEEIKMLDLKSIRFPTICNSRNIRLISAFDKGDNEITNEGLRPCTSGNEAYITCHDRQGRFHIQLSVSPDCQEILPTSKRLHHPLFLFLCEGVTKEESLSLS